MQKKRIAWFLVMIAVGLGLGLAYGWLINPLKTAESSASALRADYKTDYVLMVAEIYHAGGDLEQAVSRLTLLGSQPPAQIVSDALLTARSLGYMPADLSLIEDLAQALQKETETPENEAQP